MVRVMLDLPGLPEGYEYTGEFRVPKRDELYAVDGTVLNVHEVTPQLIVKVRWIPPKGIFKSGWIARDGDGTWWWSIERPTWDEECGTWRVDTNDMKSLDMCVLPDCVFPDESLRRVE